MGNRERKAISKVNSKKTPGRAEIIDQWKENCLRKKEAYVKGSCEKPERDDKMWLYLLTYLYRTPARTKVDCDYRKGDRKGVISKVVRKKKV